MVSLNQLDQLISINQTLSSMSGTPSTSSSTQGANTNAMIKAAPGSTAATGSSGPNPTAVTTPTQQQPAYVPSTDPNALMNLYGSFATPSTN